MRTARSRWKYKESICLLRNRAYKTPNGMEKSMTTQTKDFKDGTTLENIKQCLKEGYDMMSYEEFHKEGKKLHCYYVTSTLNYKGKIMKATKKQLQNIEKIYKDGGRLLWLGDLGNWSVFYGNDWGLHV